MFDTLVKTVLEELQSLSQTKTIIGDPIEVQNQSIIPVSKVSIGFGIGGGDKDQTKQMNATGGGVSIEPLAFIVISEEKVEMITLEKAETRFGQVIDLVPRIFDKVKSMKNGENKSSKKDSDS